MTNDLDLSVLRKDFPALHQKVYGHPLVYFDNAATAQKPQCVIDEELSYYQNFAANVNRGAHYLSEKATSKYNQARVRVAQFINAQSPSEIIFTRSTTESINLLASCLGKFYFQPGDEIILTQMEHHSNIVPWYLLAKELNLVLRVTPLHDDGTLDLDCYRSLFNKKTKLATFIHASNSLGTINPIKEMVAIARAHKTATVVDGAQAIHHLPVDVLDIDTDFYAFSSHKLYGPTGVGVLYGKKNWLDAMPPYQGGGDMIASVSFDAISFAPPPHKFEAGTPNIAGVLGLAKAIEYIQEIGFHKLIAYEEKLSAYLLESLKKISKLTIIGNAPKRVPLVSFVLEGIHPHDISSILDREGIAVRAGHLCTQPLMKRFGISALSRASLSFYNTTDEIDRFADAFKRVFEVFSR
ncbi:MAG: cysteine desulfurase [Myxococcales bacterium]|nr:cysteine desulfurase [Myxococcales bacterium]USN50371.1 MAG: cysteine desulfurase [Myxococcales bacterium]